MSELFQQIINLIKKKDIRVSAHGYDELSDDGILVKDILDSVENSILLEEYPNYYKGPCILVLHKDNQGKVIHVVWGIPNNETRPAILVTAYIPDSNKWSEDFTRRVK